jgi:hypothetical protein
MIIKAQFKELKTNKPQKTFCPTWQPHIVPHHMVVVIKNDYMHSNMHNDGG